MLLNSCGRSLKVLSLEYRTVNNLMSTSFPVHSPSSNLDCTLVNQAPHCFPTRPGLGCYHSPLLCLVKSYAHFRISVDLAVDSLLKHPSPLEILFLPYSRFQSPHLLLVQYLTYCVIIIYPCLQRAGNLPMERHEPQNSKGLDSLPVFLKVCLKIGRAHV